MCVYASTYIQYIHGGLSSNLRKCQNNERNCAWTALPYWLSGCAGFASLPTTFGKSPKIKGFWDSTRYGIIIRWYFDTTKHSKKIGLSQCFHETLDLVCRWWWGGFCKSFVFQCVLRAVVDKQYDITKSWGWFQNSYFHGSGKVKLHVRLTLLNEEDNRYARTVTCIRVIDCAGAANCTQILSSRNNVQRSTVTRAFIPE